MDDIQIMALLMFLLGAKHFVADFIWQTDKMVMEKGTYGASGGLAHSAIHGGLTWLCLAWLNPIVAIFPAVFDFLVHYHVDWAKMNINKKYGYTPQDRQFWFWLGVDQFAHYVTYVLIIGWYCGAF
jgi:hypothetical protein